jgi:hypothetical protein
MYVGRLISLASTVILFYIQVHQTYLDKTGSVLSHGISLTSQLHLEHTDAYSPHPLHIEMEEFSDVRFKRHAVIEFLTAEKVPPIEIRRRMQTVYGDRCADVSIVRRWVRRFKVGELGASRSE